MSLLVMMNADNGHVSGFCEKINNCTTTIECSVKCYHFAHLFR